MVAILSADAKPTMKIHTIKAVRKENMMIKNWKFNGDVTSKVNDYPYQNTLADPSKDPNSPADPDGFTSFIRQDKNKADQSNKGWEYYWGTTHDVDDEPGVAGQNSPNPKSTFGTHQIVEIFDKYYDPGYGTGPYVSLQKWEDDSVAGFYVSQESPAGSGNWRLLLRPNKAGPDVKISATSTL